MSSLISDTERVVLGLLGKALFSVDYHPPEDTDWQKVFQEAYIQSVLPLVASASGRPVRQATIQTAQNMRVISAHSKVDKLLGDIPYIILKGYASAEYYPDPVLRVMGDVDFLVPTEYVDEASSLLSAAGYSHSDTDNDHHVVFYLGEENRLELHYSIPGIPSRLSGEAVKRYMSDIFQSSHEISTPSGNMRVPSPLHHCIIILLHMIQHMTGAGIGLRHLCDWAVFANSVDISQFEAPLKEIGIWHFAQILTQLSVKYLGMASQNWSGETKDYSNDLLLDIIQSGNFGRKDGNRAAESLMVSTRGQSPIGRNRSIKQFFVNGTHAVQGVMPITKKVPVLLPIGWIFWGGRRVFRQIRGTKPTINPLKAVQNAESRKMLYQKLCLFEPEKTDGRTK